MLEIPLSHPPVYKDLIISTIVDSQYSLLRSISLRPNPR